MAREWDCFLWAADEWIVNYSLLKVSIPAVQLFSVGHAFELYLKAASSQISGDVDRAVGFGHNVIGLWRDCKGGDRAFLPEFELRQVVLDCNLLNADEYGRLGQNDLKHFLQYQEIYVVSKYLPDLKYLGAPMKRIAGAFAVGSWSRHPMWAELIRSIRQYLGHPVDGRIDKLQYFIDQADLPVASREFLRSIVAP